MSIDCVGLSFCADPGFIPGEAIPGGGGEPCRRMGDYKPCAAPILTKFKEKGERGILVPEFQAGLFEDNDTDFPREVRMLHMLKQLAASAQRHIVPVLMTLQPELKESQSAEALPWGKRKPQAFFRGTLNCNAKFPHRLQGK